VCFFIVGYIISPFAKDTSVLSQYTVIPTKTFRKQKKDREKEERRKKKAEEKKGGKKNRERERGKKNGKEKGLGLPVDCSKWFGISMTWWVHRFGV